jgi:prepilin peptidase CpaA
MESLPTDTFLLFFLSIILVSALVFDIWRMRIPNVITFPAMAVGLVYHAVTGGAHGFILSLGGLALCLGIFLIPYAMGGMGAGDVKLMGAVGAILGPGDGFIAMLFTGIIGGIYALVVLFLHLDVGKDLARRWTTVMKTFAVTGAVIPIPADNTLKKQPMLRYGVAIVLGTFSLLLWRFCG